MEAEMVGAGLALEWRRPSVIGGTVAVVILMVASVTQAQPVNSHGQPLPWRDRGQCSGQRSGCEGRLKKRGRDLLGGNEPIRSDNELTKKIHVMAPGSSAQFTVLRQGKESPLSVTLGRLPDQSSSPAANPR